MQTHWFRQGPFPYCLVSSLRPEEEGREVGRHATLSPGLREEGSWDLLLATCQPAGSSSASYQGRDSTSVSRPGWGQQPQLEGGHGPVASGCSERWLRTSSFLELITESFHSASTLISAPRSAGCWLPTSSHTLLLQINTRGIPIIYFAFEGQRF